MTDPIAKANRLMAALDAAMPEPGFHEGVKPWAANICVCPKCAVTCEVDVCYTSPLLYVCRSCLYEWHAEKDGIKVLTEAESRAKHPEMWPPDDEGKP